MKSVNSCSPGSFFIVRFMLTALGNTACGRWKSQVLRMVPLKSILKQVLNAYIGWHSVGPTKAALGG